MDDNHKQEIFGYFCLNNVERIWHIHIIMKYQILVLVAGVLFLDFTMLDSYIFQPNNFASCKQSIPGMHTDNKIRTLLYKAV